MCCNLPPSVSEYMKISLCNKVRCDYDTCDWSHDGYDTEQPTSEPTPEPTEYPTASPSYGHVCNVQSRDICCNQNDRLSINDKKRVCNRLGCMYNKCGWKKDGYDDDDDYSEPASKSDGYDDKYDDKDLYDQQWNSYKKNDNGGDDFEDAKNDGDDDKYDHVNDYDDDKCTSAERRVCCLANEKKQWTVCNILGCNVRKVSKI